MGHNQTFSIFFIPNWLLMYFELLYRYEIVKIYKSDTLFIVGNKEKYQTKMLKCR